MSDKLIRSKLSARGIGKYYHELNLTEYPDLSSNKVIKWLETADAELEKGRGIVFYGDDSVAYDLTILAARALVLKGSRFACQDFYMLLEQERREYMWQEKPPLAITNFTPNSQYVDAETYKRLETLLNYYLDHKIPLFVHLPVPKGEPVGDIVSSVFLHRLLKSSTVIS
jgi:hypothetical protein